MTLTQNTEKLSSCQEWIILLLSRVYEAADAAVLLAAGHVDAVVVHAGGAPRFVTRIRRRETAADSLSVQRILLLQIPNQCRRAKIYINHIPSII